MDKYKDNGIILGRQDSLKYFKEVMAMAENNPELLNSVYREISEKLGIDTAMEIYRMFRGQQIRCSPAAFKTLFTVFFEAPQLAAMFIWLRFMLRNRRISL